MQNVSAIVADKYQAANTPDRLYMSGLYQGNKKAHPVWQDQNERIAKYLKVSIHLNLKEVKNYESNRYCKKNR